MWLLTTKRMNFTEEVTNWYSINKRDLPWRNTKDPYFIWLSEIILQQTQVNQGLPYYLKFTEAYPTVFDLANAPEEDVLKLWQGLGYYSRARNLHESAKYIANVCGGKFPKTYDQIIKLKGVGDYTASAISSIAFNEPNAVVDGNVYRLFSRFFGIETPINSTEGIKEFKALSQSLIEKEKPGVFNQAIMEFGARQCKPKSPDCSVCPLKLGCVAHQKNIIDQLPVKLKKQKIKHRFFNYLVIIDPKRNTIFEKRTKKGIWQNLFQFPLIESEASIKVNEFSKLNIDTSILKGLDFDYSLYNEADIIHKLSHQHLYTKFWIIDLYSDVDNGISVINLKDFPTSVLISNFIEEFNFET